MVIFQLLASGLLLGGVYALIALGLSLIFGVMRLINFAQGEFIMLGMYFAFWLYTLWGVDPYVSAVLILPVAFGVGILLERLLFRPIASAPPIMQMLLTFGLSLSLQNVALIAFGGTYQSVPVNYASSSVDVAGLHLSVTELVAFLVSVGISVSFFAFLRWTRTGKGLRAVQQNRYATLLMGVNVQQLRMLAFGIGIALAGLAGVLLAPIYFIYPSAGAAVIFLGFVIVVLGGLGNLIGAVLAGLLIGVVETFSGYFLPLGLKESVALGVFFLVLLARPAGLFGARGSEELGFK